MSDRRWGRGRSGSVNGAGSVQADEARERQCQAAELRSSKCEHAEPQRAAVRHARLKRTVMSRSWVAAACGGGCWRQAGTATATLAKTSARESAIG